MYFKNTLKAKGLWRNDHKIPRAFIPVHAIPFHKVPLSGIKLPNIVRNFSETEQVMLFIS